MRNIIVPALCAIALFGSSLQAQAVNFDELSPDAQTVAEEGNIVVYDMMGAESEGSYY